MIPGKRRFLLIPEAAEAAPVEAVVPVAAEVPAEEAVRQEAVQAVAAGHQWC